MAESNDYVPSLRDEMAGIYVYVEGPEKVNVPPRGSGPPAPPSKLPPLTTDELAGVYDYVEAPEKVHVPRRPPAPPPPEAS